MVRIREPFAWGKTPNPTNFVNYKQILERMNRMEQDNALLKLSDRSFVKHLMLNTELYQDEFNNIIKDFPAYDILVECYDTKKITPKQREVLTNAYLLLKEKHFRRRF